MSGGDGGAYNASMRTVKHRGASRAAFEYLQQHAGKPVSQEAVARAIGVPVEAARSALYYIANSPASNPVYRDVRQTAPGWFEYGGTTQPSGIGDQDGWVLLKVLGTATGGGWLVLDEDTSKVYVLSEAGDL